MVPGNWTRCCEKDREHGRMYTKKGDHYREMGLSSKLQDMSEDEQFALLATDGMLVKRPLVVGEDYVLTGFKEDEWTQKLKA